MRDTISNSLCMVKVAAYQVEIQTLLLASYHKGESQLLYLDDQ